MHTHEVIVANFCSWAIIHHSLCICSENIAFSLYIYNLAILWLLLNVPSIAYPPSLQVAETKWWFQTHRLLDNHFAWVDSSLDFHSLLWFVWSFYLAIFELLSNFCLLAINFWDSKVSLLITTQSIKIQSAASNISEGWGLYASVNPGTYSCLWRFTLHILFSFLSWSLFSVFGSFSPSCNTVFRNLQFLHPIQCKKKYSKIWLNLFRLTYITSDILLQDFFFFSKSSFFLHSLSTSSIQHRLQIDDRLAFCHETNTASHVSFLSHLHWSQRSRDKLFSGWARYLHNATRFVSKDEYACENSHKPF